MDDLLFSMGLVQLLVVLVSVQIASAAVAALFRKPRLAVIGSAIVGASICAAAVRIAIPGSAGHLIAGAFALVMGFSIYHLTILSIKRGSNDE